MRIRMRLKMLNYRLMLKMISRQGFVATNPLSKVREDRSTERNSTSVKSLFKTTFTVCHMTEHSRQYLI